MQGKLEARVAELDTMLKQRTEHSLQLEQQVLDHQNEMKKLEDIQDERDAARQHEK